MPTELRSRTPRARKPHACDCCTCPIPAGTVYHRTTLVYDGHVYDWVSCCPCNQLVNTVWRFVDPVHDEGIGVDEFTWWADVHRDDPEHGEAARAFLARVAGGGSGVQ